MPAQIATRANDAAEGKDPAILDTLARAHFMKGEKDKAIELQEKAIKLADTAERWLRDIVLAPTPLLGVAKCEYLLAARHLHRFGPKAMSVFVESCTVGAEKRDYYQVVRAAYGLILYGPAAKEHIPVLEYCLKKLSGHKDYAGRIKPQLETSIAIIKGQEQFQALEDVLKKATGF